MARLYGRSLRGTRCLGATPHGHWKTTTFVGGLRLGGMTAPMVLDGAWMASIPGVDRADAGSNARARRHRRDGQSARPQAGCRAHCDRGHRRHTALPPPYSPDLNPIEMAFSKFKALLKKAAARTIDDLRTAIAQALPQLTPNDCANYFTAAGYGSV